MSFENRFKMAPEKKSWLLIIVKILGCFQRGMFKFFDDVVKIVNVANSAIKESFLVAEQ